MLQIKITHLCLVLMLLLCKTSNFSICKNCCDCLYDSKETDIRRGKYKRCYNATFKIR